MTRSSWLIFYVGFLPMFIILFQPSWKEYLIFFLADYVALFFTRRFDEYFFLKLFPDSFLYFLEGNVPRLKSCSTEETVAILHSMFRFPQRRAIYCALLSFIKAIPGTLVIVFYWQHPHVSNSFQFSKLLSMITVMYFYFYGATYIENLILTSSKIASFHKQYNWTQAFKKVNLPAMQKEFGGKEASSLFSIWIFMLWLQGLLVINHTPQDFPLEIQISVVGFAGLLMVSRIWFLFRSYFLGGLENLIQTLDKFDLEQSPTPLPLHSSPVLASFEKTFNDLIEKIDYYKNELSQWVSYHVEESRYRALGEISALVVHDLSGPLHVINFCTQEIQQDPTTLSNNRYIEQLVVNGHKCKELIDSLKTYLRGSGSGNAGVNYLEAHEHVTRLLQTQFANTDLEEVKFSLDAQLDTLLIEMSKADFIHVLLNLIKNSYENFLKNKVKEPHIKISVKEQDSSRTILSIRDNGSGFSPRLFEELTGSVSRASNPNGRKSLGLRLVRRLIERYGGKMEVYPLPVEEIGTEFHLSLKLMGAANGI